MQKSLFVVAVAAMFALPAFAADDAAPAHVATHFDARIDTWAEGIVMAINADGGSLTIRGIKRPYATAYAAMLKDIADQTSRLSGDERVKKETEIRAKHADGLAKARTKETTDKDGDFTFYLPKEKNEVVFADETHYYDRENAAYNAKQPSDVKATEYEKQAMLTFKDLKIGDRVTVGYDSGITYNNAHAIVKVREATMKPVKASLQTETQDPVTPRPTEPATAQPSESVKERVEAAKRLDADTENARQIRRSLVADEGLSVKAKNVVILTENGTFTLKGLVESEVEKENVAKKAAAVVGSDRVVNQLEITK